MTGGVPADLGQNGAGSTLATQQDKHPYKDMPSEPVLQLSARQSGTLLGSFQPPNNEGCKMLRYNINGKRQQWHRGTTR